MKEICVKKIPCCGCPEMDTCTLEKSENLLKELFTRYGNYNKEMSDKNNKDLRAAPGEATHRKRYIILFRQGTKRH